MVKSEDISNAVEDSVEYYCSDQDYSSDDDAGEDSDDPKASLLLYFPSIFLVE